jgi:hypothetical protein
VALLERALRRLADRGERLRQEVVQRFTRGETLAEVRRPATQIVVGHGRHRGLRGIDPVHELAQTLQLGLVRVEEAAEEVRYLDRPR